MIASRRRPLLPAGNHNRILADVGPGQAQEIPSAQAGMGSQVDGVRNLDRAGLLQMRNVAIRPDDLGAIIVRMVVNLLDPLAWVGSDLTQRIDSVGEQAGQYLHAIVRRPRLLGIFGSPLPNDRPDPLRPIELRDPQLAEMVGDAV
nr:hypothetical protein [Mesorhizobium sp. B2-4-17]